MLVDVVVVLRVRDGSGKRCASARLPGKKAERLRAAAIILAVYAANAARPVLKTCSKSSTKSGPWV